MMKGNQWPWSLCLVAAAIAILARSCGALTLSSKMIHRFSDEARGIWRDRHGGAEPVHWPRRGSVEYYGMLWSHDIKRSLQRRELLAEYQSLYFSQGSETIQYGESLGWLHYTRVDIGTPNISFLVALDTGSDLFWVPCDCIQCAPTSASIYGLDRDLSVYSPAASSTSKHLSCTNNLCTLRHSCKTKRQACPYIVDYLSDNTSTSGSLVEDVLYLASGSELASGHSVKTRVVIGCGRIQSGGFLNGGAPDGLLGLGLSDISVPSLLAKAGLVQNSFSMCFQSDDSGRIFFGDQGASGQKTTPFLAFNGTHPTYIVGVEDIHVGSAAVKGIGFKVLIDSGTSFTYLPSDAFKRLAKEFDAQVPYPKAYYEGLPWDHCYQASGGSNSSDSLTVPVVSLIFKGGGKFSIFSPIIRLFTDNGTLEGFCLAVQEGDFGIIGQNFMTSYHLVFDRENLKLGWSPSDCYQLDENEGVAPAPSPQNGLRTPTPLQQQQTSPGRAVSPAIAGRTPKINHSDCLQTKSNIVTSMLFSFSVGVILLSGLWHTSTSSY